MIFFSKLNLTGNQRIEEELVETARKTVSVESHPNRFVMQRLFVRRSGHRCRA